MPHPPRKYFLQNGSIGYLGNSPQWWREGGSGYTTHLNEAQQFTMEECREHIRSAPDHMLKVWPVDAVLAVAHMELDVQDYRGA